MVRISFWGTQVLASCPQQMLNPTQTVPGFSPALPKPQWWEGGHAVFGKVREGRNIVDTMKHSGPGNGKTSKKLTMADCAQIS